MKSRIHTMKISKEQSSILGIVFILFFSLNVSFAQTIITFNTLVDVEVSKAGDKSHYYYNEIDQENVDWRIGVSQFNLMGGLIINSNWSLNSRLLLEREKGQKQKKFSVPQLNVRWISDTRKFAFTVGKFNNPFGSFNQKQLSTNRSFIGTPLSYSYYSNISPKIGFLPDMGDVTKVSIDGGTQWGSSNLYYGGYSLGAMFGWNIKPSKANLKFALITSASNRQDPTASLVNIGFSSRLKLQPTYFWEQGISLSHGTFDEQSEVSDQLEGLNSFTQTLIGTDFKLGKGFLEFSGEIIGAQYEVPQFNHDTRIFDLGQDNEYIKLKNFSGYLDIKYEVPVISGSYIAYRFDHLRFGNLDDISDEKWDNNVLRHSVAVGYDINQYLLIRMAVSTQNVKNKELWKNKQDTFRLVLTAHY